MRNQPKSNAPTTENDPRWLALQARDRAADGTFFYSVKTTAVFCKPSCASRGARPENIEFHATCADAQAAGFRACKRCKPDRIGDDEAHLRAIVDSCRKIDAAQADNALPQPSLNALATQAGMSPYYFHRMFKSIMGLTPKAYATARRTEHVRSKLTHAQTITDAIFDAGYNSNARFYENADRMLGMTPSAFRDGGADAQIRFAIAQCSLGALLVAQSDRGVCAISLGDDAELLARELQDQFPRAHFSGNNVEFDALVATVVGFIEAPHIGLDLPLDLRGTVFQLRVWQALSKIPAGATLSYRDVALRIGAPKSMRAVAGACAANRIAVAIPCHRVVRTDGALSGYRWGVARKRQLLQREAK